MDEGIQSVQVVGDQRNKFTEICLFPDADTEQQKFNGIPYAEIPILHIKVSKNNTKLTCLQPDNQSFIMKRSCVS